MDRGYDLIDAMKRMADSRGGSATVAQIALAWLLYQPVVSTVIVGAKRADQLADNLAACDVEFTAAELAELDQLSQLPPEYPGWMLGFQSGYRAKFMAEPRKPK
ncbi:aldo/keto reductase [Novosphingobium sp. Gsoil 351]|uniref:aldo/keto reductase n=1 Tax=Novosphingobium sp. Gsoil 351 TaxID=2675225 RepID=UPI00272EB417|nr:aldo/keto reductase [Novosphingobium sp. Gsoil 351]